MTHIKFVTLSLLLMQLLLFYWFNSIVKNGPNGFNVTMAFWCLGWSAYYCWKIYDLRKKRKTTSN